MQYTFEKMHEKSMWQTSIWQARLNGEFVCYVIEDVSGEGYTDSWDSCLEDSKSAVADKYLYDDGYENREDFYNSCIEHHIREF